MFASAAFPPLTETSRGDRMRHASDLLQLPGSAWNAGFLAVLILSIATVAGAQAARSAKFTATPLPLPGANGLVMLDYFAYDHTSRRLWVPAANTGSVDVIDTRTDQIKRVEGFSVAEIELRGKLRPVGPSSVAVGDGVVYIGSRADSKICAIDSRTLELGDSIAFAPTSAGMAAAPDGLIYIAATRELWATSGAPPIGIPAADRAIKILSAVRPKHLTPAGKIPLPGSAEGYAVEQSSRPFLYEPRRNWSNGSNRCPKAGSCVNLAILRRPKRSSCGQQARVRVRCVYRSCDCIGHGA